MLKINEKLITDLTILEKGQYLTIIQLMGKENQLDLSLINLAEISDNVLFKFKVDGNIIFIPVEEKKAKKTKFTPPTLQECKDYFQSNGYSDLAAEKFFNYYTSFNWHDSRNKPVHNWKQKAIAIWFKDENRIKTNEVKSTTNSSHQPWKI